ncbi:rRNA-processing protein fcf1 [Mortierella sp. AD032]|nr:rRNA-processing protein fcf1 [Mortierella sp. AD032]
MINPNDARLKVNQEKLNKKEDEKEKKVVRHMQGTHILQELYTIRRQRKNEPQVASSMFFNYNSALGPPCCILVDTNFINFSIQNKIEQLVKGLIGCLYAKSFPCITECVMAELEKLGPKFKIEHVMEHKCYIVATCDRDLKRRVRNIPGIPIMYLSQRKYTIERLPGAYGAPTN